MDKITGKLEKAIDKATCWEESVELVMQSISEIQQLQAENEKLEKENSYMAEHWIPREQRDELQAELVEMKKALNMEEAPSQFHPKIPYKWKYEHELKRNKRQSKYIQKLQAELKELKSDLLEFGRHSEGCNYPYGAAYGCKCGWLETEQALKGQHDKA